MVITGYRYFKFVSISLFFAMWLEFFYKFGATYDPDNFIGAIFVYFIYLSIIYFLIIRKFHSRVKTLLLVFGFLGLMAEWFLIGNSPWGNPQAFQLGMFVFHAVYPICAISFVYEDSLKRIRKYVLRIFAIFSVLCGLCFLINHSDLKFAAFIWLPLFPYFFVCVRCLFLKNIVNNTEVDI